MFGIPLTYRTARTGRVLLAVVTLTAATAPAALLNLRVDPFAAAGDGVTDDRPALAHALAAARRGDTVVVPAGRYRLVLTATPLSVPAGVTLRAPEGAAVFSLVSDAGSDVYRAFLRLGSDTTLDGIAIERAADFPTVLMPLFGPVSNVTLRNCRISGQAARYPDRYCHALQVGVGELRGLHLASLDIEDCHYGLFQANDARGSVDGVLVERCRFSGNAASDLEFNSPRGVMRNIVVRDCQFRDNRCPSPGAGFAVGFANVHSGLVENCRISGYRSEALHVEDRSADIRLAGNHIDGGSLAQPNGVVMVLSGSQRIAVHRNVIDARSNTNAPHLVLVTAGGSAFACPTAVNVTDNILVNGAATRTWYLQPGSGPPPTGNVILPAPTPPPP